MIELLVVIAIVAILAAILFPVFARARENARRASCSSNLKQIGLGLLQYTQDYDELYPARENNPGVWAQAVQPYVKSTQLFACPSNSDNTLDFMDLDTTKPAIKRSYVVNPRLIPHSATPRQRQGSINEVAQKILVSEASGVPWNDVVAPWHTSNNMIQSVFARHLGTLNALFADGHVKAMRPSATATPFNMWGCMGRTNNGPNGDMTGCINENAPDTTTIMPALAEVQRLQS